MFRDMNSTDLGGVKLSGATSQRDRSRSGGAMIGGIWDGKDKGKAFRKWITAERSYSVTGTEKLKS